MNSPETGQSIPNIVLSPPSKGKLTSQGSSLLPWIVERHIEEMERRGWESWNFYGGVDIRKISLGGAILFKLSG